MTSKTITDRAGDTLRVSTGSVTALPSEVTIKVIENARDRRHVAAVHVDPVILRAALDEVAPAGSYTRTDEPDDMDGGVTAALIAKEAEQRACPDLDAHWRLDEAQETIQRLTRERDEARGALRARLGVLAEPRPVEVTDAMIERARQRGSEIVGALWDASVVEAMLTAALTEPPKRPEGAEELARLIATADVGEWDCGDLADALLATGRVRVVTEEQP